MVPPWSGIANDETYFYGYKASGGILHPLLLYRFPMIQERLKDNVAQVHHNGNRIMLWHSKNNEIVVLIKATAHSLSMALLRR